MKTVHEKDKVRQAYWRDKKSKRWIAREFGMNWRTVRKLVEMPADQVPKYHRQEPKGRPVLGPYIPVIQEWLKQDVSAPRKQRHTIQRNYDRLCQEYGFTGSYSGLRDYVNKTRKKGKEVFIPLAFEPGEMAQVDWGDVTVILAGSLTKLPFFAFALNYSGGVYVEAFDRANQEAFFEGHTHAFQFFDGIPDTVVYDNLASAVQTILKGNKREENERFTRFREAWLFKSRFCNPARGNEKGRVENMVKYAKNNFFTPVPVVESLAELNALLRQQCLAYQERIQSRQTESVGQRLKREKEYLLPLPTHLPEACSVVPVKADKSALVQFETNRYSVPCDYAYKALWLKAFVDRVEITDSQTVIATHYRLKGRMQESIRFEHYRKALERKPGAEKHFRATNHFPLSPKSRKPERPTYPELTVQAPNLTIYSRLRNLNHDPTASSAP
jgi:transposase